MKKKKKRVLSIIELNHIEEVKVVWAKLNNGITCNQILEDLCLDLEVVKRYKESRYFYFDYLNEIATILAGKRTKIINDSDFKEYLDDEIDDSDDEETKNLKESKTKEAKLIALEAYLLRYYKKAHMI